MSKLPSFDEQPPQYKFAEKEGNSVHERNEGVTEGFPCPEKGCKEIAKSKAGLASHHRAKHEIGIDEAFDNDIVTVYAKASVQQSAMYNRDLNMWIAPVNVQIPKGFMIYEIDRRVQSMMLDNRSYNVQRIVLVREDKMFKGVITNE